MDNYLDYLNKDSEKVLKGIKIHKSILDGVTLNSRFQFERKGFFCLDKDSDIANGKLIWNETVGLVERKKWFLTYVSFYFKLYLVKLKIKLIKNFNLYNFPVKVGILLSDSL